MQAHERGGWNFGSLGPIVCLNLMPFFVMSFMKKSCMQVMQIIRNDAKQYLIPLSINVG